MQFRSLKELDSSEGTVQLYAGSGDDHDQGHLILHPAPNPDDPNDPLRWPSWKKNVCFASVCAFTFLTNFAIGGLAPAFYQLSIEFNKTPTEASNLLLWPILTLGIFNFFWVPIANRFGKRPVFVFATLLLCMAYLWGALAQSFESLLWSNIVGAFAGSATEALGASLVNDLYFLHQRGNMMGIYMNVIAGGNTVGPLICGFVITNLSWRWHKWIAFILVALNFLAVLLFCPETQYDRAEDSKPIERSDMVISSTKSGELEYIPSEKAAPFTSRDTSVSRNDEKQSGQSPQLPKKTWYQELGFTNGIDSRHNLLELFVRPWPMIVYPAVIFSFLGYAVSLAWVVEINVSNSFILQAPPYNWKPDINGLINIPGLIGNLIGSWLGGWAVDRYSRWRSWKNDGVFLPETRLHLLIIPAVIVPAGCLVFGYGAADTLNWTSLFFGYGMVAVGLTFVPVVTMTYVSDSYLPVNADALMLVNGLKNVVAFGFLYGAIPWVQQSGYRNAFAAQAGIYVFIMLLAVPLTIFGPRLRHITALWHIIL